MDEQDLEIKKSQWWRRIRKNSKGKPLAATLIQLRTLSTAAEIIGWMNNIPFHKISMSLYFFCKDVGMAAFTRSYEAQLELAAANPERFAAGLHKFYSEMARKIEKEDLYDLYFEFYYRCVKIRVKNMKEKASDLVTTAYQNLLIQQLEYLRPDKYDLKHFVAGRKTTGELMLREEYFPNYDVPIYQMRCELEDGRRFKDPEAHLYELYRKEGIEIWSEEDQLKVIAQDKIHTTTCTTMLPFINEYTFDILPQQMHNANSTLLRRLGRLQDLSGLDRELRHRKRTLPTNGARVVFRDNPYVQELLFKEILYDNAIYMLYRLRTADGDLSGFYETRDGFFYSVFFGSLSHEFLTSEIRDLVLYCYASLVLGGEYRLADIGQYIRIAGCDTLVAEGYGQGDRLRNVYDAPAGTSRREGEYEAAERSIQGYIRRLPPGQKASIEAVELALSLGYELESNETYVRPFIKQVYRLKEKQ